MKYKCLLNSQINKAPEPLRSYIHEMESFTGNGAHMIQENFMLREQLNELVVLNCKDPYPPIFFLCKCEEEIEGSKDTDEHQIICPKCGRKGQVELLPF